MSLRFLDRLPRLFFALSHLIAARAGRFELQKSVKIPDDCGVVALLDVNVPVALFDRAHPNHDEAHQYWGERVSLLDPHLFRPYSFTGTRRSPMFIC